MKAKPNYRYKIITFIIYFLKNFSLSRAKIGKAGAPQHGFKNISTIFPTGSSTGTR